MKRELDEMSRCDPTGEGMGYGGLRCAAMRCEQTCERECKAPNRHRSRRVEVWEEC